MQERSISPFGPKPFSPSNRGNEKGPTTERVSDEFPQQQQWTASHVGNSEVSQTVVSWKSDPKASFSDWRLEIYSTDNNNNEKHVFHVHRNIVGHGPRKSEFLRKEFINNNDSSSSSSSKVTKLVDFTSDEMNVFPLVLDFMYYTREVHRSQSKLTATRACLMYKISERLEIVTLQKALSQFYRKNINLGSMQEFITAAKVTRADGLLDVSKAKIGTMVVQKPALAGVLPPKLVIDIIEYFKKQSEELNSREPGMYSRREEIIQSQHMSRIAYICASHNQSLMTDEVFGKLTGEEALPVIDVTVAFPFLTMSAKFGNGSSKYTSLQRRCVKSISQDWQAFQKGFSSPQTVTESLKFLPSHVLADILVTTMNR